MEIKKEDILINHFYIILSNLFIPLVSYFFLVAFGKLQLAQVAFITGIAPTAIASPIIINLLKGKIEYVVISILLTNFVIAFLLPFLIPEMLNSSSTISFSDVLFPVAEIFLIPFFLSLILKKYFVKLKNSLENFNKYVFYVLILNINLGTAKASNYIGEEMGFGDPIIYQIAAVSFFLCFLSFFIGWLISTKNLRMEGSQSLGQKNNGFTVWVALTFISPLAVLGPVFYILFQNTYISWQLHQGNKSGKIKN
ncbi:MAG: bile acid:sodium symporter [Melioribacteraceae bacterium]